MVSDSKIMLKMPGARLRIGLPALKQRQAIHQDFDFTPIVSVIYLAFSAQITVKQDSKT